MNTIIRTFHSPSIPFPWTDGDFPSKKWESNKCPNLKINNNFCIFVF